MLGSVLKRAADKLFVGGLRFWVAGFTGLGLANLGYAGGGGLRPTPLSWLQEFTSEAYQCVQSDLRGNVWFFRGDRWAVYPVGEDGMPGKEQALHPSGPMEEVREAALDAAGEQWLVLARKPRLFREGRELPLGEVRSIPFGCGFLGSEPALGLWPVVLGQLQPGEEPGKASSLPWIVAWDGRQWNPVATHRKPARSLGSAAEDTFSGTQMLLVPTAKGAVLVSRYHHQLQFLDARGKVQFTVAVVGSPLRESAETGKKAEAALRQELERRGVDPKEVSFVQVSKTPLGVQGVRVRGDGTVFLVVSKAFGGESAALERWDPVGGTLSRVPLELAYEGKLTLACGKKGLFLAAHRGHLGRWFIPWESLETAPWEEVAVEVTKGGSIGH